MAVKVSIDLIKELRERTGAGLMDCKNALANNDCDIEKSITWLREKGITKVAKKAGRVAAEGRSLTAVSGDTAVIYEVNSETDFVSESPAFGELAEKIGQALLSTKPETLEAAQEAVKDLITDYTVKLGEKLDLRRFTLLTKKPEEFFGAYIHMGGKVAALLEIAGGTQEEADDIALCLAAAMEINYITEAEIPQEAKDAEIKVQLAESQNDPNFAKKPEAIQHKIVEGKVNKILLQSCFTHQEYIPDPSKTVIDVLKANHQSIVKAVRYRTGEGIEKKVADFAAEVAAQLHHD